MSGEGVMHAGAFLRPAHGGYPDADDALVLPMGAIGGAQVVVEDHVPSNRDAEPSDWLSEDLRDVIAYLEQRRDNAATMAAHSPEFRDWAEDRRRQLDVMIDEIRAGLCLGAAGVRARLLASRDCAPQPEGAA